MEGGYCEHSRWGGISALAALGHAVASPDSDGRGLGVRRYVTACDLQKLSPASHELR
jgi:hypothetical protein